MIRERLAAILPSQFLRFAICGGIAAAFNILSRIALSKVLDYGPSILVSYMIGLTTAFLLMKLLVFETAGRSTHIEYLRFGAVNLLGLVQVWVVSLGLARWVFPAVGYSWHVDTTAHILGVLSPIATSYLAHRAYTFG